MTGLGAGETGGAQAGIDAGLVVGAALFVLGGPVLAFPDVVPPAWRVEAVTLVGGAALATGGFLVSPWPRFRAGLWIFAAALAVSWLTMASHDVLGTRHFAGTCLGVLVMAVPARWTTTSSRLVSLAAAFAAGATAVLLVGLIGSVSSLNSVKFLRWNQMLTVPQMEQVAKVHLPLPGLEGKGQVNPNALGGTALLVLPTCVGALLAAGAAKRRGPRLAALVATVLATTVLAVTLSRTAWAAALATLVILGLARRPARRWVACALLVSALALGFGLWEWRSADPVTFDASARASAGVRIGMWRDGLDALSVSPWFGVGINQFHGGTRTRQEGDGQAVPHAHNVWLQGALDVGLVGLAGYVAMLVVLLGWAAQSAASGSVAGRIAGGAGLSLVAVHVFGTTDVIALGAKVGAFQWLCAGLVLAAVRLEVTSQVGRSEGAPRSPADSAHPRRVIYVSVMRLSDKVRRDWFIDHLMEGGIPVEYWDVFSLVYGDDGRVSASAPFLRTPGTWQEVDALADAVAGDAVFVMLATYEAATIRLFRAFSVRGCRMLSIAWGGLPVGRSGRWERSLRRPMTAVRNLGGRVRSASYRVLGLVRPFEIVFAAGAASRAGVVHALRTVPINMIDYDHFVASRTPARRVVAERYAVFLDIYLPHQSDLAVVGLDTIDAPSYYASLSRFFERFENAYGLNVVIAAHPKATYDEATFRGRVVLKGMTPELVRDSEYVLSHHSTAVSYAVLNAKPIVFIYTRGMAETYELTVVRHIQEIASYLDAPVYDIDDLATADGIAQPACPQRYEAFRYSFLTSPETEHLLTRDIFLHEVRELLR